MELNCKQGKIDLKPLMLNTIKIMLLLIYPIWKYYPYILW